jgi:hypothetical protein
MESVCFPSLLASWMLTLSFLLLIWRKFNVLLLCTLPAGNLQVVGWKKSLSTQAMHWAPPQAQTHLLTNTHTNPVEYNSLTHRILSRTRSYCFHPQCYVGWLRAEKLAVVCANQHPGKGRSGSRGRNIPSWGRKIRFVLSDWMWAAYLQCTVALNLACYQFKITKLYLEERHIHYCY